MTTQALEIIDGIIEEYSKKEYNMYFYDTIRARDEFALSELKKARDEIASLHSAATLPEGSNSWVSVTERLPDEGLCIASDGSKEGTIPAWFCKEFFILGEKAITLNDVTMWQPLPLPPKN